MKKKKVAYNKMQYVSDTVRGKESRFKPGSFIKILSIVLLVVSALLGTIAIFRKNGYHLINGSIMYYLLMLAVAGVLAWLVYGARKLVKRRGTKKSMTVSMSVISAVIMIYVFVMCNMHISYGVAETGRSISPNQENTLVILRTYYIDVERMTEEAKGTYPDYTDEQIGDVVAAQMQAGSTDLFCYAYVAYPVRLGMFYCTNDVEVGPELLIVPQDSDAELRVNWTDEKSARLYAEGGGEFVRGEFTVKLK